MLAARRIPLDAVGSEGVDPELLAGFREAKRQAQLSGDGGEIAPGDAASAINDLQVLYESLLGDPA